MSMPSLLLDEMFLCVDSIGYEATLKLLQNAQRQNISFNDERVNAVVSVVCKEFSIQPYELFYGRGRHEFRNIAFGFCIYYLHSENFFQIHMKDIARMMRKQITNCYVLVRRVKNLNEKHKSDSDLIVIKNRLDINIKPHLELLKDKKTLDAKG